MRKCISDDNVVPTLIGVLENGIALAYQGSKHIFTLRIRTNGTRVASKIIDPKLRLEKFLVVIVRISSAKLLTIANQSLLVREHQLD